MKTDITLSYHPKFFPDTRKDVPKPPPPTDWATVEELRVALFKATFLAKDYGITKSSIARTMKQDNLFELLKIGTQIRREVLVRLAGLFGLTLEEFLGLDEKNFDEYKQIISDNIEKNDSLLPK